MAKGPAGGAERAFGVARYIQSAADPRSAELAVTVTDDAQGCGLGRRLLEILSVAARERGIDTFEASVLYGNLRVHALLQRFGAVNRRRDGEVQEYAVDAAAFVARRSVAGPRHHAARAARWGENLGQEVEHDPYALVLLEIGVHGLPNLARRGRVAVGTRRSAGSRSATAAGRSARPTPATAAA